MIRYDPREWEGPEMRPPVDPDHDPSLLNYCREPSIASEYDEFHSYNRLFETDCRFLKEVIPPASRVLDVGCGTGRHLVFLAGLGHRPTGLDLSNHMLREAGKKLDRYGYDARLVRADMARAAETAPFVKGEFDAVICMFSTLGLLRSRALRLRTLRGFNHLLRPGGILALHTHNLWHNLTDPSGRRWLLRSLFESLLPGREFGDRHMAGYRGLENLYLHVFRLGEIRRLLRGSGFSPFRETLLDDPRTGEIGGFSARWRANGFLVAARKT